MYDAAIVLEGGAMRGVYTSGVLDALMDSNLYIKNIYGISAGSKNGQYYPTHQRGDAFKVDLFCSNNSKAISVKNFFFHGGIINKEYYTNFVLKDFAPIDINKMKKSGHNFYIGATNCNTGKITFFEKSTVSNYEAAITASCSMPIIQSMVMIDSEPYLDGGIACAVPYKEAMEAGNKKIVLVLTREKGFRSPAEDKFMNRTYTRIYKKYPKLLTSLTSMRTRYNQMMDEIDQLEAEKKIFVIRPSSPVNISRLERDMEKLSDLYKEGYQDTISQIEELKKYLES